MCATCLSFIHLFEHLSSGIRLCTNTNKTKYLHLNFKFLFTLAENLYGLPRWLIGKDSACQSEDARNPGSIPGSGRSPGAGNSNPIQYSCLENSMDREARWVTVHEVPKESDTTEHTSVCTLLSVGLVHRKAQHPLPRIIHLL